MSTQPTQKPSASPPGTALAPKELKIVKWIAIVSGAGLALAAIVGSIAKMANIRSDFLQPFGVIAVLALPFFLCTSTLLTIHYLGPRGRRKVGAAIAGFILGAIAFPTIWYFAETYTNILSFLAISVFKDNVSPTEVSHRLPRFVPVVIGAVGGAIAGLLVTVQRKPNSADLRRQRLHSLEPRSPVAPTKPDN